MIATLEKEDDPCYGDTWCTTHQAPFMNGSSVCVKIQLDRDFNSAISGFNDD